MAKIIRKYDHFQYFEEDCHCEYCYYNQHSGKDKNHPCSLTVCCCADIRADAIAHKRIKRKRGWFKHARSE